MASHISYTIELPDDLMQSLDRLSAKLSLAKNEIIEKALRLYLDKLKQLEYASSFKRASQDKDMFNLAEASLKEYLDFLDEL